MRGRAAVNLVSLLSRAGSGKAWESLARGIVWAALALVIGCFTLNLGVAIDSPEIVTAFDMDEGLSGEFLRTALSRHSLDPNGFFNYGYSYIAAPYFVVRGLERLGYEASDYLVFYVGRAVSLACYVIAVAATYCAVRRVTASRTLAVLAAGVLGSFSSLTIYAQIFRPDLPQVASVALAFACLAMPTTGSLLAATAFAALGFGLKYSGAFVLVAIAVSAVLAELSGRPPWRGSMLRRVALVAAIPAIFVAVWLVTNPYVIPEWSEFRADIAFERAHVQRGHHRAESPSAAEWIHVVSRDVSTPVLVALAIAAVALLVGAVAPFVAQRAPPSLGSLRRALRSPRRRFLVAAVVYVVVAVAFLLLEVRMRRARYWMHILPAVVIVAAAGFRQLSRLLPDRVKKPVLGLAGVGVAVLLAATASARSELGNRTLDERVRLGEWVARRYAPSTRILADAYSYLPPHFTHVKTGGAPSVRSIQRMKPELVILSRNSSGASCWMREGTHFRDHAFECNSARDGHEGVQQTLEWLASEPDYAVKWESDAFVVFAKGERAARADQR